MWIIYALSASVLWGLAYVINEQIYKKISLSTCLGITTLFFSLIMLAVAYQNERLMPDLGAIASSRRLFFLVFAEIVILVLAELCTGLSIVNRNAILTSLIGISYPVFIVIFGYTLFKEDRLNFGGLTGGLLIFAGIFILYKTNT